MRKFVAAFVAALALAAPARADHEPGHAPLTTKIAGKTYATGYLARQKSDVGVRFYSPSLAELPDAYDARTEGRVTPIKNQGSCGSCWSFARARAFETALIDAGHPATLDLAEQDALVNDRTAYGCDGGFMDGDFEVQKGVTTEALCPYRANDGVACNGAKYAKATRWAMLGQGGRAPTVDELRAAVYEYGTIFVTVAAGGSFSPGAGGRITTCGSRGLNHMVTLQGYRPATGGGYEFLVGNSWGTGWGDGGYAWSKQGCNQLASVAGDAAGFFYVEHDDDDEPDPQPAPLDLPIEVIVNKGRETAIQVRPQPGVRYRWSTGTTGARIYITPASSQELTLTATKLDGSKTSQSVKVTVKP